MSHIITELNIYPVKSLGGTSVPQAKALFAGFQYDRRWMLLDADHKFITQREIPQLALFRPALEDDCLKICFNADVLTVGIDESTSEQILTQVWDDRAETIIVSHEANDWFSSLLGRKVIMVKIQNEDGRTHHNKKRDIHLSVSLADGYPYLAVGSASLDLLNSKLKNPVPMSRFRPNIVLSTQLPHEEDTWGSCQAGDVHFLNMKPCGRCMIVTIDQDTAAINNETLKTLNVYRKSGNSVLFGTNMMCTNEGLVKVGDIFYT